MPAWLLLLLFLLGILMLTLRLRGSDALPTSDPFRPLEYPDYLTKRVSNHGQACFYEYCTCMGSESPAERWPELTLHADEQDTEAEGWHRLLDLVDRAAADGREEFDPGRDIPPDAWQNVVTLPPSIAKLKSVRHLILYSSNVSRIPPEIGEMAGLEEFTPYKSYRLHWFPYEITRCKNLRQSTVSTRALYGNWKFRPPFPQLPNAVGAQWSNGKCSVCGNSLTNTLVKQAWISLVVGSDVLPLLVTACSEECIRALPKPAESAVQTPHTGGRDLRQPSAMMI